MTPDDRRSLETITDAFIRWQGQPPIKVGLLRGDAYIAVGGLQLLTRNPDIEQPMKDVFERVGRALQVVVSDDPDLYALLELGWNAAHDVKQDPPGTVATDHL